MANSFFLSSTTSTRHSSRVRSQPLSKHWHQFKAWSQHYAGKPFEKQHQLHLPQKHKATIPESTLGVEMN